MAIKDNGEENLDLSKELNENNNSKRYCSNCGEELDAEDKFCESCGKPVKTKKISNKQEVSNTTKINKKKYKCPNCGSPLKSFEATCPYCKTEIREIDITNSIKEFTKGLDKIQSRVMPKYEKNPSLLKKVIGKDFNKKDKKEKFEQEFKEKRTNDLVNYIINYPIPNSKEDLLEFMILSTTNVNLRDDIDDEIQQAWITKMKQINQKAKITIKDKDDLDKITRLYNQKIDELNKKKNTNRILVICGIMLYFVLFGLLINPIGSIIILLLLIALGLFTCSKLSEKKIIDVDLKLSKKLIQIICCICVILAFIIFLINIIGSHQSNISSENYENGEAETKIDYRTAEEFEKALNNGKKVNGKIVKFIVIDYKPNSTLGINCWAGEHLNFISEEELDVQSGDTIIGKVTEEPNKLFSGSWKIKYNVLSMEKQEEKKEEEDKADNSNEQEDEKKDLDSKTIIMIVLPEEYIGKDAKSVENEMKGIGYTNIVLFTKETTDSKNKDGSIFEFTIAGKKYERGDTFTSTDEVKIGYWKYVGKKLDEIVLPQSNSKLGKDFDDEMSSEKVRYYFNLNGVNATITDGVYEYLEYLKSLGYQVEITNVTNKNPYAGFHTYETNFKVYSNDISWTMYLSIQDEKYIEYEFDINLK